MAPHHVGPANLLWGKPTGYAATMVGFPYDDLESWRGPYPLEIFARQFAKTADGFDRGVATLRGPTQAAAGKHREALRRERSVAEAAAIQFRSAANQAQFIAARDRLAGTPKGAEAGPPIEEIRALLHGEIELAKRLYAIQASDSRIGFEATNHYFFVPLDLAEKVLNCRNLLDRWLPAQCARLGIK